MLLIIMAINAEDLGEPYIIHPLNVAYILADDSVIEREFGAFKNIEDNYPKYVLTMDKFDFSQNGIIHKNVIDWLLEEEK